MRHGQTWNLISATPRGLNPNSFLREKVTLSYLPQRTFSDPKKNRAKIILPKYYLLTYLSSSGP